MTLRTSSRALGDGISLSLFQDGDSMGALSGQALAPASPSASPAKAKPTKTSGIYGLRGSGSSASAALALSLASRLQARLDGLGSTMFVLTWKAEATPQRRPICRLAPSVRRTSGPGCSSWPTPMAGNPGKPGPDGYNPAGNTDYSRRVVELASWPTPNTMDSIDREHMRPSRAATGRQTGYLTEALVSYGAPAGWPTPDAHAINDRETLDTWTARREAVKAKGINGNGMGMPLAIAAQLSSWPTPTTMDSTRGPETNEARRARGAKTGTTLIDAATWASPKARDFRHAGLKPYSERGGGSKGMDLNEQAAHHLGPTLNGSLAPTGKRAQLNPEFSLYLMGYPRSWLLCAPSKTERRKR